MGNISYSDYRVMWGLGFRITFCLKTTLGISCMSSPLLSEFV